MAFGSTAVFSAVGRFGGLIKPANQAADALSNVKSKASGIGSAVPADGGSSGRGLLAISRRANDIGSGLQETGNRISGVGGKMTKGITLPVLGAATAVGGLVGALGFKRLVGIDTARGQFKGLGFDADKTMKQVDKGVTNTSLSMAEGAKIAVGALSSGNLPMKDLGDQIKRVANVSAAYGVEAEQAGYLMNNMLVKNKVTWGDLSQMQMNGIPIVSQLAEKYDVTGDKIMKMAQDGKIGIEDVNEVLDKNAGKAAESYAETWEGIVANVKANAGKVGAKVLEGVFPDLKAKAAEFLEYLRSDEAAAQAEQLGKALREVASVLGDLISKVVTFSKEHPKIAMFVAKFALLAVVLGPVLLGLGKMISLVGGVVKGVGAAAGGIQKFGKGMKWAFGKGAEGQASRFARSFDGIRLQAGRAAEGVKRGAKAFGTWAVESAKAAGRAVANAAKAALAWVKTAAKTAAAGAKAFGVWIAQSARAAGAAVAGAARAGAAWVVQSAKAAASMAANAARIVAGWVLMGVQSLIQAARMAAAWLLAMGPIPWIIAAVVALGILIYKNWDKIVAWTKAAWDVVFGWIKTIWGKIKSVVVSVGKAIADAVSKAWNAAKDRTVSIWNAIKGFFSSVWNGIKSIVSRAVDGVKSTISRVFDAIKRLVQRSLDGWKKIISVVWAAIKKIVSTYVNGVKTVVSTVFNWIKNFIQRSLDGWKRIIRVAWDFIKRTFSNATDRVKRTVSSAWDNIKNGTRRAFDAIKSKADWLWQKVKIPFDKMKAGARSLKTAIGKAKDGIRTAWAKIHDALANPIKRALRWLQNNFINKLNRMLGKIPGVSNSFIPSIPGYSAGGWTGPGSYKQPAGMVHADEFVVKKKSRNKFEKKNPGLLDYINTTGEMPGEYGGNPTPGYYMGGKVGGLNPRFKRQLDSFNKAAGGRYSVYSGYRSNAHQALLYARYLAGQGPVAARPGSSQHNRGLAADLAPSDARNHHAGLAARHGLAFTVPSESWHIEPMWGRGSNAGPGKGGGGFFSKLIPEWVKSPFKWAAGKVSGLAGKFDASKYGLAGKVIPHVFTKIKSVVKDKIKDAAGKWGFSRGGYVSGRGIGDVVQAALEPGEFVQTKKTVKRVGLPALRSLERGESAVLDKQAIARMKATSMMSGVESGLARPQPVAMAPQSGRAPDVTTVNNNGDTNITTNVYNPTAEKASDSVQRRLSRTAQLGLIGGRTSSSG